MSSLVGTSRLRSDSRAFTVIETVLFLAISSGMLLIALSSIRGRSDEVQFEQSMRAIESYVQLQQNNVQNGVIPSSSNVQCNDAGGNECIVLGRAIEFAPDTSVIRTHVVSGGLYRDSPTNEERSVTLIDANPYTDNPAILGAANYKEISDIDWQAEFVSGEMRINGMLQKTVNNRIVGFIRLPNGTEILPLGIQSNVVTADPAATAANAVSSLNDRCMYGSDLACPANTLSTAEDSFEANLCFRSADGNRFAQLKLGGDERRQAVELEFLGAVSCI